MPLRLLPALLVVLTARGATGTDVQCTPGGTVALFAGFEPEAPDTARTLPPDATHIKTHIFHALLLIFFYTSLDTFLRFSTARMAAWREAAAARAAAPAARAWTVW